MTDGPIGLQLLIVFLLILINAFFAASEIAVISLNENKVRREAEEGNKKAKKLLKLVDNPGAFLSTIQIAITLAGFLASAFAADSFSERLVLSLIHISYPYWENAARLVENQLAWTLLCGFIFSLFPLGCLIYLIVKEIKHVKHYLKKFKKSI